MNSGVIFYKVKKVETFWASGTGSIRYWNFYVSETITFHTVLTSYGTIPDESAVLFNEVLLNEGNG